jgi:hypothetical protein
VPIFLISLIVFILLLRKQPRARANLILAALGIYLILIFIEQIYLEHFFSRSFHISDPSVYFDETYKLSIEGLVEFLSSDEYKSNRFYYVINWLFYNNFFNTTATAVMLKITNALVFLSAYQLLPRTNKEIDYVDFLLLFHPFLLYMLVRNVRDAYIIFFLCLFMCFSIKSKLEKIDVFGIVVSLFAMYFVRSFFIAPMLLFLFIRTFAFSSLRLKFALLSASLVVVLIVGYVARMEIFSAFVNGFLGNAVYFGGETQQDVDEIRDAAIEGGGLGGDFQSLLIGKVIKAAPVFLFTPHPFNWGQKHLELSVGGVYGIYTDVDSVFIVLGAVVNYLVVYPMLIKLVVNFRRINLSLLLIPLSIMAFYVIFLLGNADMRIRYTFILFIVFCFTHSGLSLYRKVTDLKYLMVSLAIFLAIPLLSNSAS